MRSASPTTSSTSAPAPACMAVKSSRRACSRMCSRRRARSPAQYMSGKKRIEIPAHRHKPNKKMSLRLLGASGHNLKNVDLEIPAGLFTAVTGVSGSGKSTLINDTLYALAANEINGASHKPAAASRSARAWICSTRSSTSTSRRSAARRARIRRRTPACSRRCASCSPRCPSRVRAVTRRAASASTCAAAAAKRARAMA